MKEENSETCHLALCRYQEKYGDDALTETEQMFLYGVINYEEFKIMYTAVDPWLALGISREEYAQKAAQGLNSQ